jgi:hypothetical protein
MHTDRDNSNLYMRIHTKRITFKNGRQRFHSICMEVIKGPKRVEFLMTLSTEHFKQVLVF